MSVVAAAEAAVTRLRRNVAELHGELVRNALVIWTAGNVSARVPGQDLLVIKPSGVRYDEISPENMVVIGGLSVFLTVVFVWGAWAMMRR